MQTNKPTNDPHSTKSYRVIGRVTILQVMAVVAILGLVATWLLDHFFS